MPKPHKSQANNAMINVWTATIRVCTPKVEPKYALGIDHFYLHAQRFSLSNQLFGYIGATKPKKGAAIKNMVGWRPFADCSIAICCTQPLLSAWFNNRLNVSISLERSSDNCTKSDCESLKIMERIAQLYYWTRGFALHQHLWSFGWGIGVRLTLVGTAQNVSVGEYSMMSVGEHFA